MTIFYYLINILLLFHGINALINKNYYLSNQILNKLTINTIKTYSSSLTNDIIAPTYADNSVWSFIDDVYLITTYPSNSNRFEYTKQELISVNLWDRVNVRTFKPDDEDRVRGCYTSHIAVLKEIQLKYNNKPNYKILILEDNLELTNNGKDIQLLNQLAGFFQTNSETSLQWDVFHLAYMMYVPGLSLNLMSNNDDYKQYEWSNNVVNMISDGSASVGTSSYLISKSGVDSILKQHELDGYKEAIPNIMARLFPNSRYASYPMIFHRAGKIGSLVNPQLDDFRKVMFNPIMYSTWEKLMVSTGLQNNQLFPSIVISLFTLLSIILYNVIIQSNSINNDINSNSILLDLVKNLSQIVVIVPLLIALWGASLFKSGNRGAGFAASAQKKD